MEAEVTSHKANIRIFTVKIFQDQLYLFLSGRLCDTCRFVSSAPDLPELLEGWSWNSVQRQRQRKASNSSVFCTCPIFPSPWVFIWGTSPKGLGTPTLGTPTQALCTQRFVTVQACLFSITPWLGLRVLMLFIYLVKLKKIGLERTSSEYFALPYLPK